MIDYNIQKHSILFLSGRILGGATKVEIDGGARRSNRKKVKSEYDQADSTTAPPMFIWVTQRKTEHIATLIDPTILDVVQEMKDWKSNNYCLSTLEQDSKVCI